MTIIEKFLLVYLVLFVCFLVYEIKNAKEVDENDNIIKKDKHEKSH